MAIIKNDKYAGKLHVIGSFMVEFDESGVASVISEVAQAVAGLPGFVVFDVNDNPADLPEVVEPVVEEKPSKASKKGR